MSRPTLDGVSVPVPVGRFAGAKGTRQCRGGGGDGQSRSGAAAMGFHPPLRLACCGYGP